MLIESDASLGVTNMGGVMRPGDGATALPSGAAKASTWDADLIERAGTILDRKRAPRVSMFCSGGANLVRGARAGVEMAQVYARVDGVRRLIGWSRVSFEPG